MTEYEALCNLSGGTASVDIYQHLPTLRNLSKECRSITEMGVRSVVSTFAFAEGLPEGGVLLSIDIEQAPQDRLDLVKAIVEAKKGIFEFHVADTTAIAIEDVDMLFIDTLHTETQLAVELQLHGNKAQKYLAFHDTVSFASELWPAIAAFMGRNPHWQISANYKYNNGLLILERK